MLAGVVLMAACNETDPSTSAGPSATAGQVTDVATTPTTGAPPTRPIPFEVWTEELVDASRPTQAGAETPAVESRTLRTTMYLPEVPEPAPLVVFSHGLTGHPDKFSRLLSAWAAAGYVVAAPAFPLTNDRVPGAPKNASDLSAQPGDVSFVIDEVLAQNDDPSSRLHGRIDPQRVAAAGLSLGGATTYAVTFNPCCRDERITAAMVLAGGLLPAFESDFDLDGHVPLLIVHGDDDQALRYRFATNAFGVARPPVWLVTLLGGAHATPFENDVTPYDELVMRLTTDFWDATIGRDPTAFERMERDAAVDGLSTVQARPS